MNINEKFEITFTDRDDLALWYDIIKKKKLKELKKSRIEKLNKIQIISNPTSISFVYEYWQDMFEKEELRKLRIEKLKAINESKFNN